MREPLLREADLSPPVLQGKANNANFPFIVELGRDEKRWKHAPS